MVSGKYLKLVRQIFSVIFGALLAIFFATETQDAQDDSWKIFETDASIFLCELQYLGGDIFCHGYTDLH
jgi:hypothetical protein